MPTEAGKGEHKVYLIVPKSNDTAKLTARNHYIGIDAVTWYVNKESSWFMDRMASGTLEIKLAGGLERYSVALGAFELKGGSRTAPIFDRPAVPDRNYRGGEITFTAQISAIKKDTALSGILKSAANATLGVAAGMVSTATIAGPSKLLGAAGDEIISGVQTLLTSTGEKKEPLFDFTGVEKSIRPEDIVGPEVYLLIHRGVQLVESELTVDKSGLVLLPFYNGAPLDDGTWLLIRIRRSDEYSGVRDWFDAAKQLRIKITNTVEDYFFETIDKTEALAEFSATSAGGKSTMDEFLRLRSIISNDGVLSEREALFHVGNLRIRMKAAKKAVTEDNKQVYYDAIKELKEAISQGVSPSTSTVNTFAEEIKSVLGARVNTIAKNTADRRVATFDVNETFATMQFMKNAVSLYSST